MFSSGSCRFSVGFVLFSQKTSSAASTDDLHIFGKVVVIKPCSGHLFPTRSGPKTHRPAELLQPGCILAERVCFVLVGAY